MHCKIILCVMQVTSAVVMGRTAGKLQSNVGSLQSCYYGIGSSSDLTGTPAACNLAIAAGAVTLALCVIFSALTVINVLREADPKAAHLIEFIVMIIVELLWIATVGFLIYQLAAKTSPDLEGEIGTVISGSMTDAILVIVFSVLSLAFTVSFLQYTNLPADPTRCLSFTLGSISCTAETRIY
jgi:hypothetical protein